MLNVLKKLIHVLIILSLTPLPAFAMEEDDLPASKRKTRLERQDEGGLTERVEQGEPLLGVESPLRKEGRTLKRIMGEKQVFLSAVKVYNRSDEAVSSQVLTHFDDVFFDERTTPRTLVGCCHNNVLYFFKGLVSLAGGALVSNDMIPMYNYVRLIWIPSEFAGPFSQSMFGIAPAVNAPVSLLEFYDFGRWMLERKKVTFQEATKEELEGNCPYARVFPKSKTHKVLKVVLGGATVAYLLMPLSIWWSIEQYGLAFALGFGPVLPFYYGIPYWRKGSRSLDEWYAKTFYVPRNSQSYLIRKAICTALNEIKSAVEKDDNEVDGITNRIWKALRERTGKFGLDIPHANVQDEEITSALSVLLSLSRAVDLEQGEGGQKYANRFATLTTIEPKSFSKTIPAHLASGLMWLNLIPGVQMEHYAVSWALTSFTSNQQILNGVGYSLAALFSTRLVVETAIHKKSIKTLMSPCTPETRDHLGWRRTLRGAALIYAANALLFTALYWASSGGSDIVTRGFFTLSVFLRYFSLFYTVASDAYNRFISDTSESNINRSLKKNRSTFDQRKTKIYLLIRRLKPCIKHELTDDTVANIFRETFNAL